MNESSEKFNTEPVYPTEKDVNELRRIVDTKANGTNIHELATKVAILGQIIILSKTKGWNETRLKEYNEEKEKLNRLLLGLRKK